MNTERLSRGSTRDVRHTLRDCAAFIEAALEEDGDPA